MGALQPLREWRLVRLDPSMPIPVATKNFDKFREIATLWGSFLPPVIIAGESYHEVDESGDTYEENAIEKAAALAEITSGPALADDSGIEVEAIGWGPSVRSARTPRVGSSSQERNEHVLRAVEGKSRLCRFVCVCALVVPGFEPLIARGEVEGMVAERSLGHNGFGYDPIFWYPPYGATFAQVELDRKGAVSHRGRAIRALQAKLVSLAAS